MDRPHWWVYALEAGDVTLFGYFHQEDAEAEYVRHRIRPGDRLHRIGYTVACCTEADAVGYLRHKYPEAEITVRYPADEAADAADAVAEGRIP